MQPPPALPVPPAPEQPDPLEQVGASAPPPPPPPGAAAPAAESPRSKMDPEQAEAVAADLALTCAGFTCAGTSLAVRYLGRVAAEPSEEAAERLVDAWKLVTRRWVGEYELTPAVAILLATVRVGVEQYQSGTAPGELVAQQPSGGPVPPQPVEADAAAESTAPPRAAGWRRAA